jgi:DNA-directed RNA polymerase subunit H (RpoH/RPB5)
MSEIFKKYKYILDSRRYILEMLENRGYDVEHLKNYNTDDIKEMMSNHITGKFNTIGDIGPLDIFLEKNTSKDTTKDTTKETNTEKIYIKYRLDNKFKGTASLTAQIIEIYEKYLTSKDTLIILNVQRVLMKIGVKDKVDEEFVNDLFIKKNYFVQIFGLENFLFNVSKHQFVPKHTILTKQESQDLITKYNCSLLNIPTIKRDDVQAKYIGLRPKQICKIAFENVSSGVTEKYRYCVN